jgi:NADPH2:quinone reductase
MKAMIITGFGGPEVFKAQELPEPHPQVNEVLVRVYATSVNPVDYKIRRAGSWAGVKPPAIIGYDVSGVVEAIGPGVHDFEVGDEVYYTPEIFTGQGSYAEYHVANEAVVAHKPSNLSYAEAASIPLAGGTAWDALITRAKLRAGETVLIHGGGGGVGSLAVQIAKAAGAYVFTTCGDYDFDLVKELGADRAIDYRAEDFAEVVRWETDNAGVDVVLDTVGGETLSKSIAVTRPFGRMVSIVNTRGSLDAANRKNITLHFLFLPRARYKLDALRTLIERRQLKPVIDSVMSLSEVAKAHQKLEKGRVKGKIVLKVVED